MKLMLTIVVAMVSLLGCGGGGGGSDSSTPANPLAKYVGNWSENCRSILGGSEKGLVTLSLASNGDLLASGFTEKYFNGSACAGSPIAEIGVVVNTTFRYDSSATVGTSTIDKVTVNQPASTRTGTGTALSTVTSGGVNLFKISFSNGTSTTTDVASAANNNVKLSLRLTTPTVFEIGDSPNDAAGYPVTFPATPAHGNQMVKL